MPALRLPPLPSRGQRALRRRARHVTVRGGVLSLIALLCVTAAVTMRSGRTRPARVAYFIQASGSNAAQVPRLVGALCDDVRPPPAVGLHLDAGLDDDVAGRVVDACRARCARARLVLVPREHVTYRGVTLALNYVSGAAALLRAAVPFDYLVVLSGADYPTARTSLMAALLGRAAALQLSFFEWKPRRTWRRFARGRLGRVFVDTALASGGRGQYLMPPNEDLGYPAAPEEWRNAAWPHVGFTVAKSSGWFVWHRALVEHLVLGAAPRRLYGAFALSDASDEHIYASAVWNDAHWRCRAVDSNLRNIFFVAPNGSFALADDGVSRKRQHPYFVDDVDDDGKLLFWQQLWESPAFFTRKVRPNGNVTDKIDRLMLGNAPERWAYERRLTRVFNKLIDDHLRQFPDVSRPLAPFRSAFVTER